MSYSDDLPMHAHRAVQRAVDVLQHTTRNYFAHNGLFLASGLAFDLVLCIVPLTLLIVSILGYTVLDSVEAITKIKNVLDPLAPESQKVVLDNVTAIVTHRGLLGVVGFVLFFLFGSIVFGSARLVLNIVFQVPGGRSFLKGKGVDFLIMLAVGLLLMMVITASWLLGFAQSLSDHLPRLNDLLRPGWKFLGGSLGFVFTFALFYLLYRFSPARSIRPAALLTGSLTAACLFHISKWGLGLYVQFAQGYAPLYGALGGLLFFFLWLYYACTAFILGAEVGWAFEQNRGEGKARPSV